MNLSSAGPRFAAALSTQAETAAAVDEVVRQLSDALGGPADLLLAFVSHQHAQGFAQLGGRLAAGTGARVLLGATGESIVGGQREIEEGPALSVWAARLPNTTLVPMHLRLAQTAEGGALVGWPGELPEKWPAAAALFVLGEPFSFPADVLTERLAEDQPGIPVLGGMASGGWQPGTNRLWLGDQMLDEGAVAVWIEGAVRVRSVVSQGCRPIGRPLVITKAQQNVIEQLGGRPPLAVIQELFAAASPEDQALMRQGLHLGRVINEYQEAFHRGDFLIRNVMGGDSQTGAIAVGDYYRAGQTVQLHVRDAGTADEDLRVLLERLLPLPAAPRGALLFTCNGRGTRLFPEADHDAQTIARVLGELPLAGFFAQGEIGPVGSRSFVHGFTASLALLEAAD